MANEAPMQFGPFTRAVSAVEDHVAPPETMAGGSNMLVDPVAGCAFKRSGFSIVGDTVAGVSNHANAGILESAPGYVPCRLRQFQSETLVDGALGGFPTHSVLYRKEASSASWPTIDDGFFGTEYVRRSASNYSLLSEFGSAAYPTDGSNGGGGFASSGIFYKVMPFWYESGEGGYSRGGFEFARRFVASGSWGTLDAGRWRYYPNLRGTPLRWDGGSNDSNSSVANNIRVRPTGPFAPLWVPTVTANDGSGTARTATRPWLGADSFYLSVLFQFEDGSYSLPTYPIFRTLNSAALTTAYASVTYGSVPRGPAGTIARVLVRSLKQVLTATTDATTVDISDLRILGVLRNNTQTSFVDTLADDDGLLQDTDIVRWDLICPPRAQHIGTGDQRVIIGKLLPSQCAIELTCAGISSDYDQNTSETAEAPGTTSAVYRVTSTGLQLAVASANATLAITTVDWATYTTVKAVVDQVNATTRDATHGQWKAQIAPGADPYAASSGLCPTTWVSSSSTSAASTTLTVDATTCANMPIGYKIHDTAAGPVIPAGTYVVKKLSSTTVQMSAAASGAGAAAALYFYPDTGDTSCTSSNAVADRFGWIRVFSSSYGGMAYFKRSAMPNYDRVAKDRIYFTISSPGAASTGVSVAPNAWGASNRRDGVASPGQIMGIADVEGAAVILYSKRIGLFVNERGSNTAEDYDYRIKTINWSVGCVSPWSVVSVAGCVVYATSVGLKATDRTRREIRLTDDIYQPTRGLGDLAYEIPKCVAATGADDPDCWMGGAHWHNRLIYSYRRSGSTYGFSVYDFSLGADQTGIDALADPVNRTTYGWSTMCYMDIENDVFGPRAMGAIQRTTGLLVYGAINDNDGTNDGRVDQMFTGPNDNGVGITGTFSSRRVLADPSTLFSAQSVTSVHRSSYSGPTVAMSRLTSGSSAGSSLPITSSGSDTVTLERLQWPQDHRSPGKCLQVIWYDDAASTGAAVFSLTMKAEVLRSNGG